MDNIFIYAQIVGFIAMCFSLAAWQFKKQEHILLCYVPSSFFWSIQFFLLGAYNASLFSFVGMIKDFSLSKAHAKYLKYIVSAFILFNIILVIVFYKSVIDLMPLLVCLFCNIPMLYKDNRYWIARCNIGAQICWIIFNINVGAFMGLICCTLVITSNLIGMARHEQWEIGRCYKSFLPNLARSLFVFQGPRTYP